MGDRDPRSRMDDLRHRTDVRVKRPQFNLLSRFPLLIGLLFALPSVTVAQEAALTGDIVARAEPTPRTADAAAGNRREGLIGRTRSARRAGGTGRSGSAFMRPPSLPSVADMTNTEWFISTRGFKQHWENDNGRYGYCVYARENGTLRASSIEEMTSVLRADRPTVVFVHGSYVDFPWYERESRVTSSWLSAPRPNDGLQMIYFTWPSDDETCLFSPAVRRLEQQAEFNAFVLADVVSQLPVCPADGGRLTLMGHSHGAMMSTAAMHLLNGGIIRERRSAARVNHRPALILAAAAMDRDWLEPAVRKNRYLSTARWTGAGRYDRAIHLTSTIVLITNRLDAALLAYPARRPLAKEAVGRVGLRCVDRRALGSSLAKIQRIDVTHILKFRHTWPHYVQRPDIAARIAPVIFGH